MNSSSAPRPPQFKTRARLLLLTLFCIAGFFPSPNAASAQRFRRLRPVKLRSRSLPTPSTQVAPSAASAPRVVVAAQADLSVNKSGDDVARVGGTIKYFLVASNGGPDEAANVVLTDPIPAHTTYVSAVTTQGTTSFNSNTLTVNFGSIAAFESAKATVIVSVDNDTPRGATVTNTVSGTSDTPDPNPDDNSATFPTAIIGPFAGDLLISEFRLRGPNGANDEFIEIYNNANTPHEVIASDGSAGYAVAASDGAIRCTIPNKTVIPARGHYLCVNSVGYSLASYPAGNGTTATGNATYTTDIPDNAGIALFRTANTSNFSTATRLDAAGSTSEGNTLYKEGTGYPALTPFSIDYSFYRDNCGKAGSMTTFGTCPTGGFPKDTDNNSVDFIYADPGAISAGAGQRLGAPGPENLSSPTQSNDLFTGQSLDATISSATPPNRVRDFTSIPSQNSTFGTLDIRKRIINNTALNVTRLRFRVIDITTFLPASDYADLRPRTSTATVVSGINDGGTCGALPTPCAVTVEGTTLETPPSQPSDGGFNSSLSVSTVTLATPIPPGGSINVRFVLGIQQTGAFKFFINIEALTAEPDTGGGGGDGGGGGGELSPQSSLIETKPKPSPKPIPAKSARQR